MTVMTVRAEHGEILTYSGRYVTPLDLQGWMVDINDIAHALSMQCRFSGHVREFYSVAQHCCLVVDWLRDRGYPYTVQKQGLLHDAAEAYLQDMARPLKDHSALGDAYREAETRAEAVIADVFDIRFPYDRMVKEADIALLALERQQLMPPRGHWELIDGVSLPDWEIELWSPREAKALFLGEFMRLWPLAESPTNQ